VADVFEGTLRGKMRFEETEGQYKLSTYSEMEGVNISNLFRAFNDFGQKELTHKQLGGKAEVAAHSTIFFDKSLHILPEKALMQADVIIRDGRLKDYHTLQAISDYFNKNAVLRKLFRASDLAQKLKDVQFKELRNHIEVENGRVLIPRMALRTNILDMNVSGEHRFDLKYTYRFDLDISELMVDRRPMDTEAGEVVDDGTGRLRVFLLMTGDEKDFELSIDKAARKEYKSGRNKERGKEIKEALKADFGLFGRDTSLKSPTKPSEAFEIEWTETRPADTTNTRSASRQPKKEKGNWLKRIKDSEREEEFLNPDEF
jgi:hypothetical protein